MSASFIDTFITALAETKTPPTLFNPYAFDRAHNARRRHNLRHYLQKMSANQPTALLVGEAPGYRGCRLTGIPFYSPALLPTDDGYLPISEWPHIQNEASTTMLRQALRPCQPSPLVWNICPFHPHRRNEPQSNRTPSKTEIALGKPFLHQLHDHFAPCRLIAIGQKADDALKRWHLSHDTVRHPSHGGKKAFLAGLAHLGLIPAS